MYKYNCLNAISPIGLQAFNDNFEKTEGISTTIAAPFERAKEALEQVGLGDQIHKKPNQMSGGQQQRVAMIRALVQPFDFLLADEPISHLDETNSRIMAEIMMEEAKCQGAGVIVTSIGKHMDLPYEKILHL